jgi:hypothetical protein
LPPNHRIDRSAYGARSCATLGIYRTASIITSIVLSITPPSRRGGRPTAAAELWSKCHADTSRASVPSSPPAGSRSPRSLGVHSSGIMTLRSPDHTTRV